MMRRGGLHALSVAAVVLLCVAVTGHAALLPCHGLVCEAANPTDEGACFAGGLNRTRGTLDGTYVKPKVRPSRLYDENCPFMARSREGVKGARYTCIHRAIETQLAKAWKPSGCTLAPIDGAVFREALGDRTLWMIGDSLMWQNAISVQCLLWRAGALTGKRFPTRRVGAAKPDKLTPYQSCALVQGSKGRICHLMTSATVDWTSGRNIARFLSAYVAPSDILYTNYGVWANSPPKLNAALRTFRQWLSSLEPSKRPSVMWRETSAQHFASKDGNYGSSGRKKPCTMPARDAMVRGNWRNQVANTAMAELKVPVLPIWSTTAFALLHRKKQGMQSSDCTHFCNPGVPDIWAVMLHNWLAAQS